MRVTGCGVRGAGCGVACCGLRGAGCGVRGAGKKSSELKAGKIDRIELAGD